jgi:Raf kinase inhibitor-like YbhB/YbcL family protein
MRVLLLTLVVCLVGCGGGGEKLEAPPPSAPRQLTVTSPDFPAGGAIPARFSCDGDRARPALRFGGVPSRAAELALVVVDPDAGGFVHWTVYGLPATTRSLAGRGLPAGAREGENSAGDRGWTAPCPPKGTHRYEFRLYWLRRESGLDAGAKPDAVVEAVRSRAGGSGLLVGRYTRR